MIYWQQQKQRLREYELNLPNSNRGLDVGRVYFVILEMSPVTYIDLSDVQALKDLHQEYKARHIQIAIANLNQQVHLLLSRSVHDAVQVCLQHLENAPSSALKLASQASGDSADSISTSKEEQQRIKQDGFFKNLWKAKNGNTEVQLLLRQNLV
ncbi:hypothetical protein C2845_PM04G11790 [Panicum miliaceum]|uniref:STAS domain-containing protein n=1 Tax=Panicum miliaceum TaxID=4540 RepID=A0A3L6QNH3_PANMI|nr:hypothetical protein C2845_PM04G11790 [Panicum miliaceum]